MYIKKKKERPTRTRILTTCATEHMNKSCVRRVIMPDARKSDRKRSRGSEATLWQETWLLFTPRPKKSFSCRKACLQMSGSSWLFWSDLRRKRGSLSCRPVWQVNPIWRFDSETGLTAWQCSQMPWPNCFFFFSFFNAKRFAVFLSHCTWADGWRGNYNGGGEPNNSNGCRVEKAYFKNTAKLCTYLKCDFELQVVALKKYIFNDRTSNSNPIRKWSFPLK